MKFRRLTNAGEQVYRRWLEKRGKGEQPPVELLNGDQLTENAIDVDFDPSKTFGSRLAFAQYMDGLLDGVGTRELLKQSNDSLWNWITIAYFAQFGKKASKPEYYIVTRKGVVGSLAYRHLARTSFEMYSRHKADSEVMLCASMDTWGEMSEQLTSRQNVAYHRGFIRTATAMYLSGGKIIKGSAARAKPVKKRKPGDTTGSGSVGRLVLAVRRLYRTYDTHELDIATMLGLLPGEFAGFVKKTARG